MHEIEKKTLTYISHPISLPFFFFSPPHKNPADWFLSLVGRHVTRPNIPAGFSENFLTIYKTLFRISRPLSSPFYFFPCKKPRPGRAIFLSVVKQHGRGARAL
jgi:hypothetical protein